MQVDNSTNNPYITLTINFVGRAKNSVSGVSVSHEITSIFLAVYLSLRSVVKILCFNCLFLIMPTYFPSRQQYTDMESSLLLAIIVSPLTEKSTHVILSLFSRNTFATRIELRTSDVNFIVALLNYTMFISQHINL